ncbi:sulfate ABC transporter permease subunit CysW [Ketogulonicigenium vulgare]|uniref:Sulfate ABC transporter, permease protein CysW n=1 Tax=Ketogulonicigenium vulgare (strain WSH-001) TaxID=759362 RepID=F9Y6T0_KETVW|nr:sulfate ABC transporter permease subunit CysW [Ketogulonicigenium vulgare]ADO42760.1 sulfate ABC transporter, inner membrane subunit CysW [Ketogulonicigenium vulgare Y25]AEM40947.1 Sulfate ABC transporter, permease protein CysW [Ketogulonicigenium vulgare WSH-001]ALJ81100.1 sulfate ABC transporter permease [Ketogulonicigenium vulgare]ANW33850.1 sulfate ABC transporter permease subunit CysW [Ketogulonicigenium vulgare]AOZ54672.1 sulfate ABC transporter inner membrane protein CysW [Ketoguloni
MKPNRTAIWLIATAFVLTALLVVAPLVYIFSRALADGWQVYAANIMHPMTLHAIGLTATVAVITVPLNIAFGIAAAWAIAKFRFPGRGVLMTVIEIPFSISPIIAGIAYLFLYGRSGLLGPWLLEHNLQVMFALPGIVLVTMFVTSPFVAREVLPLMQAQGSEQEQAAVTLGASGWQVFRRVTLPNIRWALLYGAVLCTARAVGEFGGVSVVSGSIRGQTNTLPLHVELLFNDLNTTGAFAAASTLTIIALIALVVKAALESRRQPHI